MFSKNAILEGAVQKSNYKKKKEARVPRRNYDVVRKKGVKGDHSTTLSRPAVKQGKLN